MAAMPIERFADRLNEVIPVVMREFARRQQNELFRGKITLAQFVVLSFLDHAGSARMTDLAHFLRVTTAAMTGIIARMVRSGYVHRAADPKDRRIIKVKLSPKGAAILSRINGERRQMIVDVFGQVSENEREDYLKVLTHIKEILTQDGPHGAKREQ